MTQRVAPSHVREGADRAHLASARSTNSAVPANDLGLAGPATVPGLAWFMEPAAQRRPPTITRHTILSLQRSVGNSVVSGAIRGPLQRSTHRETVQRDGEPEPTKGFEPPTHALRKHCSTPELRRRIVPLGEAAATSKYINGR